MLGNKRVSHIYKGEGHLHYSNNNKCNLTIAELTANDWEVYKEPKGIWVEMTNKEICEMINLFNNTMSKNIEIDETYIDTQRYKYKNGKLYKKQIKK